ncbi:MAG: hypothetical protein ACRDS9_21615 [Pseudonocardiaceae bacterium]
MPLPKVRAWGEACDVSEEVLDRLITLTEATFTQMEAWRDVMPDSGQLQDTVRVNVATTHTMEPSGYPVLRPLLPPACLRR